MALLPVHQLQHLTVVDPRRGGALAQVELVGGVVGESTSMSVNPSVVVKRSARHRVEEELVWVGLQLWHELTNRLRRVGQLGMNPA
jgi:hypothetical protein